MVKDRKLLGIISHVSTSPKIYYPTLLIKLSAFEKYINDAKIRLTRAHNMDVSSENHADGTQ